MKPRHLSRGWTLLIAVAWGSWGEQTLLAAEPSVAPAADAAGIEFFEKKVRPLLVERCHGCHGPEKQKGNLRLDSLAAVLKGGDTSPAVVPGKPEDSLLIDAIRYGDSYQMPPKSQLPAEEISTLVEWVRQGAPWPPNAVAVVTAKAPPAFDLRARASHWSFQPIARVAPPAVRDAAWIKTPIDRFILAELEAADLAPAPATEKRALLRRVFYDLTGLPPGVGDIEAFLADDSGGAYEKVVERLLASPHYGERWARHWLDLVRYAETCGHEFDFDMPNAYRYRDYVIRALNDDLPYDRFVIEHVAGDLLSHPRRHAREGFNESVIATGCFFFGESKHSPVDVRQDEADRIDNQIDVFAKAFLGLTVSCARCHDHKFDPISTQDYYALAGYLQSSRYQQAFIDPPEAVRDTIAELARSHEEEGQLCLDVARDVLKPRLEKLADALLLPADTSAGKPRLEPLRESALARSDDVLHPWMTLTEPSADTAGTSFAERASKLAAELKRPNHGVADEVAVVFADFNSSDYAGWHRSGPAFGLAPSRPLDWSVSSVQSRLASPLLESGCAHSGQISAKFQGTLRSATFTIEKPKIHYRLYGAGGRLRLVVDGLQLIKDPIYGGLQFEPGNEQPHWHQQDVSKWIGHRAYIELIDDGDGYLALEKVVFAEGAPPAPQANRLIAQMVDEVAPSASAVLARGYQALFERVFAEWLAEPGKKLADANDRAAIINWIWKLKTLDPQTDGAKQQEFQASLARLQERVREVEQGIAPPRQALALADGTPENERVFVRGSHKTLGDEAPRRFLEILGGTRHAPPADSSGRMQLALQMVSSDNPLLPRVLVNRLWQHHFGEGIVRSPDDFGAMGQGPTHPALLDYLAAEVVRGGWSLKHLHRLMVLSSTYQMSSQGTAGAERVDAQNKLWHRMSVRRLEAESIRDAMLTVSGRAEPCFFGPSVPPHLTPYMTGRGRPSHSGPLDGNGRRSVYLAVRRNFLPPMFLAFDYPIPSTTIGRRSVSNVPAQALAMMNNPFVIEQAKVWGNHVARRTDQTCSQRVHEMYLAALGRPPNESEEQAALRFISANSREGESNDPRAWSDFAHVMFNVKEFIFIP